MGRAFGPWFFIGLMTWGDAQAGMGRAFGAFGSESVSTQRAIKLSTTAHIALFVRRCILLIERVNFGGAIAGLTAVCNGVILVCLSAWG
jgi:hypothetical protein